MAGRAGQKIKLTSIDELLCVPETEGTIDIDIRAIYPFENHPFKVVDDEKMDELVESIKANGILTPVLVRPDDEGTYEMISGHRRLHAAKRAGLLRIPAIVKEMTNDDAVIAMVDANVQREEVLPSEKAFAFKMKFEAIRHQGKCTDATLFPEGTKLNSGDIVGQSEGLTRTQVYRYIRLTELVPEILQMVDEKKIAMRPAVEISYLPEESQYDLIEAMEMTDCTPSHAQTIRMRRLGESNMLSMESIYAIMDEEKPNQKEKVVLKEEQLKGLIPKSVDITKRNDFIINALKYYKRYLERQNEQER